jgi:hypothetical protein
MTPETTDKKTTTFAPSELQVKILQKSFNMEGKPTITAMCANDLDEEGKEIVGTGINRDTWYTWNKDPEFVNWWNTCWDTHMKNSMFMLDKVSWKKAYTDFRYMELLQMKYANFRKKFDQTSNGESIAKPLQSIADGLQQILEQNDTEQEQDSNNKDAKVLTGTN